ncbi:MAG: efflux RND transporter periplasmic adaptor subunit [Deltaproteobacteria bacterium]|nr:efflux RND transporter periplasmic adaptor subunit [Deltaproteobacteria bacterium]
MSAEKDTPLPAEHEHDDEPMPEGPEPPPRGARTMAIARWVIVAMTASLAAFTWLSFAGAQLGRKDGAVTTAPKYHCPMHPQIVSDAPGECPICHMNLEPIVPDRPSDATAPVGPQPEAGIAPIQRASQAGGSAPAFACPMHPEVTSSTAGRCSICKMALEPIARDGGASSAALPGSVPLGTIAIELALDRIQAIGVRTAVAEETTLAMPIRSTAIVAAPEQGTAEVHVRTAGFVERVHVDQTGTEVGTGQTMLSVYSPEILQAQHELLATRAWMSDGGIGSSPARVKLELLGMTPADITRVLEKREPMRAVAVVAPRGGFVTKKNVVLGSYVTPEMTLYEIQDLSRVYVVADLLSADVQHVRIGAAAKFVPSSRPDDAVSAKIDLVYPAVTPDARTRRVRMQIPNPRDRALAPGEYGALEIATTNRRAVTVPRDALVDTGSSTYVFVVEREGRFAPRVVVTGSSAGERIVVEAGLQAGDRVVSGATFLIDSESRLQASIASQTAQPKP